MQKIQKTKEKKRASKKRKSESETVASCDKSEITGGIVDLKEWPGPLTCQFSFVKEHFNVVRYRCLLGKRYFDFYVPRYALDDLDLEKIPNQLKVIIWNPEASSASSIHFSGLSNIHESEVIEYGFNREMANYQLYELNHEGQTYSLYIPKAVFGDLPYPERVSLRMVVASKG